MLSRKMAICLLLCAIAVIMTSGAWAAPGDVTSGLAFWLKADAGLLNSSGTAAANGEKIATWQDQSGNVRNATQSVDAYRPELVGSSAINGAAAIKFTAPIIGGGTSTEFSQLVFDQFMSGSSATAFMVLRATGKVGYNWWNGPAWHFGNYNEGQTFGNGYGEPPYTDHPEWGYPSGQLLDDFGLGQSSAPAYSPAGGFNFNNNYLYDISMGPGIRNTYMNGNLVEAKTVTANAWAYKNTLGMANQWQMIGGVETYAPYLWGYDGLIAEVIVYDRTLTAEEKNSVGSYLADKYGIQSSYVGSAVPEPSSIIALLGGLSGLLAIRRRRK